MSRHGPEIEFGKAKIRFWANSLQAGSNEVPSGWSYFGQTFLVPWTPVPVEVVAVGFCPTSPTMDFAASHALAELSRWRDGYIPIAASQQ